MNGVVRHGLAAAAIVPVSIGVGVGIQAAELVFGESLFSRFRSLRRLTNSTSFLSGTYAAIGSALSSIITAGASLVAPRKNRSRIIGLGVAVPAIAAGCFAIAYKALFRSGIIGVLAALGASLLVQMLGTAAVVTALWKERGYNPLSLGTGSAAGILGFSAIYLTLGFALNPTSGIFILSAVAGGMAIAGVISGAIQALHERRVMHLQLRNGV